MSKKMKNESHVEGYVYEHKLEMKESGPNSKNPGTEFISGTLSVATDDEMLNVVQVHFTYVTAVTAKGKPNNTFNVLQSIIDGKIGSVMEHGKENAGKVRIDTAIGLMSGMIRMVIWCLSVVTREVSYIRYRNCASLRVVQLSTLIW